MECAGHDDVQQGEAELRVGVAPAVVALRRTPPHAARGGRHLCQQVDALPRRLPPALPAQLRGGHAGGCVAGRQGPGRERVEGAGTPGGCDEGRCWAPSGRAPRPGTCAHAHMPARLRPSPGKPLPKAPNEDAPQDKDQTLPRGNMRLSVQRENYASGLNRVLKGWCVTVVQLPLPGYPGVALHAYHPGGRGCPVALRWPSYQHAPAPAAAPPQGGHVARRAGAGCGAVAPVHAEEPDHLHPGHGGAAGHPQNQGGRGLWGWGRCCATAVQRWRRPYLGPHVHCSHPHLPHTPSPIPTHPPHHPPARSPSRPFWCGCRRRRATSTR